MIQVGDVVKPISALKKNNAALNYGIVLDTHEDDYGAIYYEVHWMEEVGWWLEHELEVVSESR